MSAVMGSIVGGSASITTAWFTQRTQARRERVRAEIQKREVLYAEFIAECAELALDSMDHTLDRPETLVRVYSLENRIRLTSSNGVVAAAAAVFRHVLERYFSPSMTREELRVVALNMCDDPLKEFSQACREELAGLKP
jgi:hypothetical protein